MLRRFKVLLSAYGRNLCPSRTIIAAVAQVIRNDIGHVRVIPNDAEAAATAGTSLGTGHRYSWSFQHKGLP